MKYKVTNVSISLIEDETLVAGSVGVHFAEFAFDESWDEYASKVAVFRSGYEEREQLITDGKCKIPWEVLQKSGILYVGVYGKTETETRPTLWAVPKTIHPGAEPAEASREPTPDKWQQILAYLNTLVSPTVSVEVIEGGHRVTITDINSTHVFDIMDGPKGAPGTTPHIGENGNWYTGEVDTGVRAEGKDGDNYILTEADKAEIINGATDVVTDSKYFDINYDGIISLKPEYRGNSTKSEYPYSISDNGAGVNGSMINELPKKIVIPEIIDNTTVTGFQIGMFAYNLQIEEIVFPDTITIIPDGFCRNAKNLAVIKNTENITSLGSNAFATCRIKKALFPKLVSAGEKALGQCVELYIADIGDIITEISPYMFTYCLRLSQVKGGANVKKINTWSFFHTSNLKNLSFLSQVTSVGDLAFACSRIQFDWSTLTNCTFGNMATPVQDNTTDYWSGCTYTPCENPIPTRLDQTDPRWADKYFGHKPYSSGCSILTIMHIHSGFTGKEYSSPEEFKTEVEQINPSLSEVMPSKIADTITLLQALGYSVERHDGLNQDVLQKIYDSLKNGCYVFAELSNYGNVNNGHAGAFYGVNDIGEILVLDSGAGRANAGFDDAETYRMPIQNLTGPNSTILIVKNV